FGIAIDINTQYSDYWQWAFPGAGEQDRIGYRNRIPPEIVAIFEQHGFISGTRWYHFDTMHFEFRPELLAHPSI
ncbi:MAG: M15 family metallopeptidase, partial [Bacteroidales bacterium]|nr:M15 family metallopeptidase [Bacteroidales bacterium]